MSHNASSAPTCMKSAGCGRAWQRGAIVIIANQPPAKWPTGASTSPGAQDGPLHEAAKFRTRNAQGTVTRLILEAGVRPHPGRTPATP